MVVGNEQVEVESEPEGVVNELVVVESELEEAGKGLVEEGMKENGRLVICQKDYQQVLVLELELLLVENELAAEVSEPVEVLNELLVAKSKQEEVGNRLMEVEMKENG